jgi:hypothetical protein
VLHFSRFIRSEFQEIDTMARPANFNLNALAPYLDINQLTNLFFGGFEDFRGSELSSKR